MSDSDLVVVACHGPGIRRPVLHCITSAVTLRAAPALPAPAPPCGLSQRCTATTVWGRPYWGAIPNTALQQHLHACWAPYPFTAPADLLHRLTMRTSGARMPAGGLQHCVLKRNIQISRRSPRDRLRQKPQFDRAWLGKADGLGDW
eukprot:gene13654-biopygen2709